MDEKYYVIFNMGKDEILGATEDRLHISRREFTLEEARKYRDGVSPTRNPRIVKVVE